MSKLVLYPYKISFVFLRYSNLIRNIVILICLFSGTYSLRLCAWYFHIPPNGVLYVCLCVIRCCNGLQPHLTLFLINWKSSKNDVALIYCEFIHSVSPVNLDRLVGCEKVPLLVKGNGMIKTLKLVSNIYLKVFGMVNENEFFIHQRKKLNTQIKQICHTIKCRIYGWQCLIKPVILAYS